MAGTELIIDDDYVNEMADFLNTRATNLQEGIDRYIQILENIRRDAIKQGATADALDTFISYAKNLSNVVEELGQTAKETCNTFISDVDESDEFLFFYIVDNHVQGILLHDHDRTFYNYGTDHQECLAPENIFDRVSRIFG